MLKPAQQPEYEKIIQERDNREKDRQNAARKP
jgi:hypothetical protein